MAQFAEDLAGLGFVVDGSGRRSGRTWSLDFNRHLTFMVHQFDADEVVLTWSFDLGEYFLERDMQIGAAETSFQELYPRHDVRVPADADAVRGEITRTLARLRLDLGDPNL